MIKENTAILLYNKKKEILMMQRTFDAKRNPGCWNFFGGGVEKGETPEVAVRRETKEELDIDLKNPRLLLVSEHDYGEYIDRGYVFAHEFTEDMKIKQHEGRARAWHSIKDALKLNLSPDVRTILEKIAKL